MAHDQQEIAAVDDILFKRDQAVQALTCVVQAYRHRLLSYGIGVDEFDTPPSGPQTPGTATATPTCTSGSQFDAYPALRCADDSATDLDKYPSVETPRAADSPRDSFLHRNFQLERVRSGMELSEELILQKLNLPRRTPGRLRIRLSDCGARYDISDRVYTVEAVHGARENFVSRPRELHGSTGIEDEPQKREFKRLDTRLQAVEVDRESMPKSLIYMGMDKAQIALLREIAHQMCKEAATERKVVKRSSSIKKSSSLYLHQQCSTSAAAGKVLFPFEAQEAPLKSTGMTS
ncbi:hypothetical protein ZIOFF_034416 [Zingiber officinale]|uniref:Uncharacterized protein n=1 Tax=Zingiber officinale TaxID=94328 RepID=A0A8J5L2G7_ZINOF|nr:hypothetical protein ZIOFF_034416 [Zingiber officinale]